MRLQDQLLCVQRAPSAGESLAVLEKINGALEFGGPSAADDLAPALVDKEQRARLDEGIHEPIFRSNEGVAVVLQLKAVEKRDRQLSPALDQAAEERIAAHINTGIEGQWELHLAAVQGAETDGVGTGNVQKGCIGGQFP